MREAKVLDFSNNQKIKDMKKKNDFGMWLFSESVSRALNWFAVFLVIIWFGYHISRFIFRF